MGPVTTNPWLIAAINMTIVFGVLIILGLVMKIIYLVDPTKNKKAPAAKASASKKAPAATVNAAAAKQEEEKIVAALAAAIAMSEDDDAVLAALTAAIAHRQSMEPLALPHYFFND